MIYSDHESLTDIKATSFFPFEEKCNMVPKGIKGNGKHVVEIEQKEAQKVPTCQLQEMSPSSSLHWKTRTTTRAKGLYYEVQPMESLPFYLKEKYPFQQGQGRTKCFPPHAIWSKLSISKDDDILDIEYDA